MYTQQKVNENVNGSASEQNILFCGYRQTMMDINGNDILLVNNSITGTIKELNQFFNPTKLLKKKDIFDISQCLKNIEKENRKIERSHKKALKNNDEMYVLDISDIDFNEKYLELRKTGKLANKKNINELTQKENEHKQKIKKDIDNLLIYGITQNLDKEDIKKWKPHEVVGTNKMNWTQALEEHRH